MGSIKHICCLPYEFIWDRKRWCMWEYVAIISKVVNNSKYCCYYHSNIGFNTKGLKKKKNEGKITALKMKNRERRAEKEWSGRWINEGELEEKGRGVKGERDVLSPVWAWHQGRTGHLTTRNTDRAVPPSWEQREGFCWASRGARLCGLGGESPKIMGRKQTGEAGRR